MLQNQQNNKKIFFIYFNFLFEGIYQKVAKMEKQKIYHVQLIIFILFTFYS